MTRLFAIGLILGLIIFIGINLLSTHLASGRYNFNPLFLFIDLGIGMVFSIVPGFCDATKNSAEIRCLCYNAVTMQYQLRFANNNNNDNDDLRIVGRSLAC